VYRGQALGMMRISICCSSPKDQGLNVQYSNFFHG
jgi:hypothetical protein